MSQKTMHRKKKEEGKMGVLNKAAELIVGLSGMEFIWVSSHLVWIFRVWKANKRKPRTGLDARISFKSFVERDGPPNKAPNEPADT